MISFKQYITEARQAPLYHATRYGNAGFIIENDILRPSHRAGNLQNAAINQAISLTRSLKTAKDWIPDNVRVVFELDQAKLRNKYKITPINMSNVWRDSGVRSSGTPTERRPMMHAKHEELFEEIITKPISPLSEYLTKIIVDLTDKWLLPESIRTHKLLYMNGKFVNQ